jgi:hypothetical protein
MGWVDNFNGCQRAGIGGVDIPHNNYEVGASINKGAIFMKLGRAAAIR